jgi:hypothetical protein
MISDIINFSFHKALFDHCGWSEPYFIAGLGPTEVPSVNAYFGQRQSASQRIKTLTEVFTSKFDYKTYRYFSPEKRREWTEHLPGSMSVLLFKFQCFFSWKDWNLARQFEDGVKEGRRRVIEAVHGIDALHENRCFTWHPASWRHWSQLTCNSSVACWVKANLVGWFHALFFLISITCYSRWCIQNSWNDPSNVCEDTTRTAQKQIGWGTVWYRYSGVGHTVVSACQFHLWVWFQEWTMQWTSRKKFFDRTVRAVHLFKYNSFDRSLQ